MLLNHESPKAFLAEELSRRIRSNPRYSQRAFAKQLGMSAGELSEVLRGQRALSLRSALKIAGSLGLNETESRHLIQIAQLERAGAKPTPAPDSRQLTLDLFRAVADWYCFAIVSLADCEGFSWKPSWIARRLGISETEARLALERLERIGLIERSNGKLSVTKDYVLSPSGIPSEAIRAYHRQILERAIQALDSQPVAKREISGAGFAVDPKHLPSIKKDISEFLDRTVAKYSKGRKLEVYQLEVALFQLTQGEKS